MAVWTEPIEKQAEKFNALGRKKIEHIRANTSLVVKHELLVDSDRKGFLMGLFTSGTFYTAAMGVRSNGDHIIFTTVSKEFWAMLLDHQLKQIEKEHNEQAGEHSTVVNHGSGDFDAASSNTGDS